MKHALLVIAATLLCAASFAELSPDEPHYGCRHLPHLRTLPFTFAKIDQPQEDGSIFREVTKESGIAYEDVSFGHAWADLNKDGYPDLFCSGHGKPIIYMNLKDGTFFPIKLDYFKEYDTIGGEAIPDAFYDMHGPSFCDVNNDGYPDLYIQLGGDMGKSEGKDNLLFLNQNGQLVIENVSRQYDLRDTLGRGRSTLWFDQDLDGYLDALLTNFDRNDGLFKTALYKYNPQTGRYEYNADLGLITTSMFSATLIRSPKEEKNHVISLSERSQAIEIYDPQTTPFSPLYLNRLYGLRDVAVGDFNGDGLQDIFMASNMYSSEAALLNDTTLLIYLYSRGMAIHYDNENRVAFRTEGPIRVESTLYPYKDEPKKYWRIGRGGYQPTENSFTLDPADSRNQNINKGCLLCLGPFIGLSSVTNKWEIYQNDPIDQLQSAIKITSSKPIVDITTVNFNNAQLLINDRLLLAQPNGTYAEKTSFLTNAENLTASVSVVAGDFDNDMDLDLILACQGAALNYPNKYYENDGEGNFTLVEDFGALGSIMGRAGAVSTADFNDDGFLDVFVENGEGQLSDNAKPLHFNNGPYQLFLNKGNSNNWVKFNITDENSAGNKLAIGSTIYCYAGGKKQIGLKGSENHAFTQNDPVIHFGLGPYTLIDSIQVYWPDGEITSHYDLDVNQTYNITNKNFRVITSIKKEKDLQPVLYPNPAQTYIEVALSEHLPLKGFEIYALDGQLVRQQFINTSAQRFRIDQLNQLPTGHYLLKVLYADGNSSTAKFNLIQP